MGVAGGAHGHAATPGTSRDHNHRQLGHHRHAPAAALPAGRGQRPAAGLRLGTQPPALRRASASALPGGPSGQVAPYDNNQTEHVNALYVEDAQKFFSDRLTVRGGARRTWGTTRFDPTPNPPLQRSGSQDYSETTWSAGATCARSTG